MKSVSMVRLLVIEKDHLAVCDRSTYPNSPTVSRNLILLVGGLFPALLLFLEGSPLSEDI